MNRVDIDWHDYLNGEPEPGIHFHGYLWVGPGGLLSDRRMQSRRTAGTADFLASDLPPEMVHHYLLKRQQLAGTWTLAKEAADWMRRQWDANTPKVTHVDPDNRRQYAEVTLSHGTSDVWAWWHPDPGSRTMVHLTTVPCRLHWPQYDQVETPCPQPPG